MACNAYTEEGLADGGVTLICRWLLLELSHQSTRRRC